MFFCFWTKSPYKVVERTQQIGWARLLLLEGLLLSWRFCGSVNRWAWLLPSCGLRNSWSIWTFFRWRLRSVASGGALASRPCQRPFWGQWRLQWLCQWNFVSILEGVLYWLGKVDELVFSVPVFPEGCLFLPRWTIFFIWRHLRSWKSSVEVVYSQNKVFPHLKCTSAGGSRFFRKGEYSLYD